VLKQQFELLQDSVSALNASKKSHQFLMTAQEDLVAEEDEEFNLLSLFVNRKIEIMKREPIISNLLWSVLASEN
jgi:hypothetical protein